ncbi:MAG: hypothetical protein CSA81_05125 [Acidobacteria bacterium]|nr:MAG: hypothetical protein CSA81_05125 [Acidobacteriota bacterium]PIE91028.1 MAG: hypothetical protein CR997_02610 [Acidobacteriota bacterium]
MTTTQRQPKILMLTLFPHSGNGSATVVRDLATVLSPQAECLVYYVDTEVTETKDYRSHYLLVDDFPVLRTHPKSVQRKQFIQLSEKEITDYIQKLYEDFASVVKEFHPDVIHVHHGWLGATVAKRIKAEFGIPYIVQFHGTELEARHDYQKANPQIMRFLDELVVDGLNSAEAFVAISPTEEELVLAYRKELKLLPAVKMIPNGYDEDIFYPEAVDFEKLNAKFAKNLNGAKLDPAKPLVMFVGRFVGFKGIEHLIRAVPHFKSDVQTILCGNGELFDKMVNLKDELKLEHVHFLGHVDHFDDLPALYNAADMLIVPSEGEPFGLVAIEAMGCGTPVVGSMSGALPYILGYSGKEATGKTPYGVLVPYGDSPAIAEAIDSVVASDFKKKNADAISQYVNKQFSVRAQAESYFSLYQDCNRSK